MAAPKTSIEFLPRENWEKRTFGRILKWALTAGRYIVIFTELIVILAFLSRFKLDRDLLDLGEEIKQKQAIVVSSASFEKEFNFLQKRLKTIKNLQKNQLESEKILTELAAITPVDVLLSDLNVKENQINFTATALSEAGLGAFINNLKNSAMFENLYLSQVSLGSEKQVGIKFQLKGGLASSKKDGV